MSEQLEKELERKLSILEDYVRTHPRESESFFKQFKLVVQAALATHKTSTLKSLGRELDTIAEELFVMDSTSTLHYRERYWGQTAVGNEGLVAKEVKSAIH